MKTVTAVCAAINALRDKAIESLRAGDDTAADYYQDCIITLSNAFLSPENKIVVPLSGNHS